MNLLRRGMAGVAIMVVAFSISACTLFPGLDAILIDFGNGPVVTSTFTFSVGAVAVPADNVLVYTWNFGDGSTAEGKIVTHSYPAGDKYTVELIISTTSAGNHTQRIIYTKTIQVISTIAFIDVDTIGDDAIFVVNSDGSNLTQITDSATLGVVDLDALDMNGFGQIVYSCELPAPPPGADDDQICAINFDGSNDRVLTSDPYRADFPSINDLGQVVYGCEDSGGFVHICVINIDGSGQQKLTSGSQDNYDAEINNLGQIAYNCDDAFVTPQICVVNFDGSGQKKLTSDVDGYVDIEINDAGLITFECLDASADDEICSIEFGGANFTQLTNSDLGTDFFDPEMNQFGQIAFACEFFGPPPPPSPGSVSLQKCVINSDGSGFRVTPDNGYPQFDYRYSGNKIAANCGDPFTLSLEEVCVFNDLGTYFKQLTSGGTDIEDVTIR